MLIISIADGAMAFLNFSKNSSPSLSVMCSKVSIEEIDSNFSFLRSFKKWKDTFDDLKMVRFIYKKLYKKGNLFLMKDILELLNSYPSINKINTNVKRSFMYKKRWL